METEVSESKQKDEQEKKTTQQFEMKMKITSSSFSNKLSKKIKKGSYANKKVRNLLIAILHLLPVNQ